MFLPELESLALKIIKKGFLNNLLVKQTTKDIRVLKRMIINNIYQK